jgi:hypothetical protein
MSSISDLFNIVKQYQDEQLAPTSEKFEFGGKGYDLTHDWNPNEEWPNSREAGVYVITDESLEVLYIGKASNKSSIGSRLGTYFRNDRKTGLCEVIHSWKKPPQYIYTIVAKNPFQAPSLEEYLIHKCDPTDNTVGRR